MAPLVRIAPDWRAIPASHVALKLVNGRDLRSAHDIQGDRLMGVAAETSDFEIEISGVEGVAETRRWLSRSLETEHTLVPSDACQNGQLPS
jgi:hypothetical protein